MNKCYQYNFLHKLYARNTMANQKNLVVMQFIKYPNFELKNSKKHEKYQNLKVIFKF